MQKTDIIANAIERIDKLEKLRAEDEAKRNKKGKVDEEVCPECGGNLLFVEEGIVFCPKCKEYFETKEDKENG